MELLLVLTIFGTITGALTQLFVSATTAEVQSNRRFQAQQQARLALDVMRNQVHCASGATVTDGGATVKLDLPSQCKGQPNTTWCAVGSGTRYALYMKAGTTCSSSGTRYADYLTSNALFAFTAATTDSLAKLQLTFPVNTKPSQGNEYYRLQDALTLRNSQRLT
jgi:Tfp pilus assembly protein PilW